MSGPRTEVRPQQSQPSEQRMALPLALLAAASDRIEGVRRSELTAGDRIVVSTRNSIYTLVALSDGRFRVSGGFYSRQGDDSGEPGGRVLAVSGCTAGGNALFTGIVAAPGLFLELGDGTRTTRIRRVRRIAAHEDASSSAFSSTH